MSSIEETKKKTERVPKWKGQSPSQLFSFSLITASMVVIVGGIHLARGVLSPVIMAAFLAVILLPPLKWLQSRGFSRLWSLIIVILSVLVIGTATTVVLTPQLKQFADDLPSYRKPLEKTLNDVLNVLFSKQNIKIDINFDDFLPFGKKQPQEKPEQPAPSDQESAASNGEIRPASAETAGDVLEEPSPIRALFPDSSETPLQDIQTAELKEEREAQESEKTVSKESENESAETADAAAEENTEEGAEKEKTSSKDLLASRVGMTSEEMVLTSTNELINFLRVLTGEMSLFASSAFIIMLLVIFMLVEAAQLPAKIAAAFSRRNKFSNNRLRGVMDDIRRYMMIKTFVSLLVGIFVTITLILTHVRYPLLWGVIAFLLNFIPNIGSVVAAIPPILLAMVDHGLGTGLIVTAAMITINCGIGYFLEPKLLGDGLDLSPLVVLLSLIFSGWLLGPVGMFLSPPIAVICKIILQSFPETRWIAVLMANSVPQPQIKEQQES